MGSIRGHSIFRLWGGIGLALVMLTGAVTAAPREGFQTEPQKAEAEDTSPFVLLAEAPPGFERFLEPQLTAVDIYYGGRLLLTTLAEYTADEITLREPEKIAAAVPGLASPKTLILRLSQTLPTNADLVCQQKGQPLCGRLDPVTAGVIFDENRFRVTLFIHQSLLEEASQPDPRYLPPPDRDAVTAVQNLSALATGNNNNNDSFSLYGTTRVGYAGHYGFADWVSTDDQSLSFDSLGYTHLLRDHEITAGLFEPDASAFRSLRRDLISGGRVATSDNLRQDLESIIASPIEIFLPTRGRVNIFRDGRLISSGFYESGNQLIDSSRLPAGAYLIDIVVTDDSGNSFTEQQLFVKSSLLPPPGQPRWFVEAGEVKLRNPEETMPDGVSTKTIRSGYRWRQNSVLSWGVAGLLTDHQGIGELSANLFSQWVEAGAEIFHSNEGGSGWGFRGSARLWDTSISLNAQENKADDTDYNLTSPYPLLPNDRWLYSLQANRRLFGNGLLGFSHSYSGSEPGSSTHRTTLRYQHNRNLGGGQALTLAGEISRVDDDNQMLLSVIWRANRTHWNHSAQADWSNSDLADADGAAIAASTRWFDRDRFADDIQAGASVRSDDSTTSLNIDGEHRSQYGRGVAALSSASTDGGNTRQYVLGYDSSLVLDEQHRLSVGGPLLGQSAVVLDLDGADGVVFDVHANGSRQFSAGGGGRVPVTLQEYESYEMSISDRGTTMASFDEAPKTAVLYVGDVDTLDYKAERIHILVSRVFAVNEVCSDVTGECYNIPLAMGDARIDGVKGLAFTDSLGYFQAEVSSNTRQLQAVFEGQACIIDLSELTPKNGVLRASRLYCEITAAAPDTQPEEAGDNLETPTPDISQ